METNGIDLTKCVNCRFRAKIDGKEIEGRIAVEGDYLQFFYNHGDIYSMLISYYREHGADYFDDLEIVTRDPETYRDWQVGDRVCERRNACHEVIFRSGELVVMKTDANTACSNYTCDELFVCGYRLVLTDIEEQIIEERKKYEPQDGDVCFVRTAAGNCFIFIKRSGEDEDEMYKYASIDTNSQYLFPAGVKCVCRKEDIRELRPATDEEKQKLFDAMAKEGKRWNAEKKVVEDIPKPHEFKKGEPVLVRTDNGNVWVIRSFLTSNPDLPIYETSDGVFMATWRHCIPYNERTMHLLGTSEDYKEE